MGRKMRENLKTEFLRKTACSTLNWAPSKFLITSWSPYANKNVENSSSYEWSIEIEQIFWTRSVVILFHENAECCTPVILLSSKIYCHAVHISEKILLCAILCNILSLFNENAIQHRSESRLIVLTVWFCCRLVPHAKYIHSFLISF